MKLTLAYCTLAFITAFLLTTILITYGWVGLSSILGGLALGTAVVWAINVVLEHRERRR